MNEHIKYDPEDIEKLLRNKTFDELLDKERAFVKNHISSEEEYTQMRLLLLDLEDQEWAESPEPPKSLRVDLIAQHKKSHKKGIRVWLNSLFAADYYELTWFQKPVFQIGIAAVLVVGTIFFFTNKNELGQPLAELGEKPKTEQKAPTTPSTDQSLNESKNALLKEINEQPGSDIVENEPSEPLIEPPVIKEIQDELNIDEQLIVVSSESETRDESLLLKDPADDKKDDVAFSDNATLTNTEVDNNFGNDKDLPPNPANTDISEAKQSLGNAVPEIAKAEEMLDFSDDNEVAIEDDYIEEVQEEKIIQEVVSVSATSSERANKSYNESFNKKEGISEQKVTKSVMLQEQSEIIDLLFTAY